MNTMEPSNHISPSNDPNLDPNGSLRRKGSFSFLRRSKSRDRSASLGNNPPRNPARKLSRKSSKKMKEAELRRLREEIGEAPPRIPVVPTQPEIRSFGGEDRRPDTVGVMSDRSAGSYPQRLAQKTSREQMTSDYYRGMPIPPVPPIPPMPGHTPTQAGFMIESMANRGRYSYASSAISTINSPRKIRRRKDPTPFNILVIGSSRSGKTSFVNFLQSSLTITSWKRRQSTRDDFEGPPPASEAGFPNFTSNYVETEVEGERVGVTLWDSEGFEKNVIDGQLKETTAFIESKFEDTFTEESRVARAPGFRDTHIHCVFMLLDPQHLEANIVTDQKTKSINGAKAKANSFVKSKPEPAPNGLDEMIDLKVLRDLKGKTTVFPIISKADSITKPHMRFLKRAVWESLKKNGLDVMEALDKEIDDAISDTSTELADKNRIAERDEEYVNGHGRANHTNGTSRDDFSMTSHLDSPSSEGSFTSADFNVANPGHVARDAKSTHSSSSEEVLVEQPTLPFSVISPDPYEPELVGRRFAWGIANPNDAEHCDFQSLKQLVFTQWRPDLREASRDVQYERWRTNKLNKKNKRNGVSLEGNAVPKAGWNGNANAKPKVYQNQPWAQ